MFETSAYVSVVTTELVLVMDEGRKYYKDPVLTVYTLVKYSLFSHLLASKVHNYSYVETKLVIMRTQLLILPFDTSKPPYSGADNNALF